MTKVRVRQFGCPDARRGFTMAEMLVAVTIMVIITAVVAGLFVQIRKMVGITQWTAETQSQLRTTVNTLAQDLQNIDQRYYLVLLNRDYGWDTTVPAGAAGAVVYPEDPGVDRRIWADRLAFVAKGPFNTLQNQQVGTPSVPVTATSARVYYGQSLYAHELPDTVWANLPSGTEVTAALNPFVPNGGINGPYQMDAWPDSFSQRPAVLWNLLRQAVLHVGDPGVGDPDSFSPSLAGLPSGELHWRAAVDSEFMVLNSTLNCYTHDDLTRQLNAWLDDGKKDWASLVWAPRIDSGLAPTPHEALLARSRLLLPHAAKVRFQVRLSNGAIVPQTDDTNDNFRVRGGIIGVATDATVSGWSPDYTLPTNWLVNGFQFVPVDPATAPGTVHDTPNLQVPVLQCAYIWTGTRNNLAPKPAADALYPVALRVRIEVYDPEKRTPDPVRVDEWLPIRWQQ